jgi:hypothetical protein
MLSEKMGSLAEMLETMGRFTRSVGQSDPDRDALAVRVSIVTRGLLSRHPSEWTDADYDRVYRLFEEVRKYNPAL